MAYSILHIVKSIKRFKGFKGIKGYLPFDSFDSFESFDAFQRGQALVTLLFFAVMGITITTAAAVIIVTNIQAASKVEEGTMTYYIAESGIEEGMLQLVRNPLYAGTETLSLNGGSTTVVTTQSSPVTILSTASLGNFVRKIQVQTVYNNGTFTIQSWKEVN